MTNSNKIARRLSRTCDNSHRHQPLIDGRAKAAAIYPRKLCEEIIIGLKEEMKEEED